MLVLRGLIGGLFQLALFAALLLIPAGTWHWPRAIQFLVVYGLVSSVSIVALARLAPASLEARLTAPVAKSQPMADRVVSAFLFLSLLAWLVFIPIDVFRLRSRLSLPESFPEAGISARCVEESKQQICEEVLKDSCVLGSPRLVSTADLDEILSLVHYQPEVSSCAATSQM